MSTGHFIMVPVELLPQLLDGQIDYNDVIHRGVYISAMRSYNSNEDDAVVHLMYAYYRAKDTLTDSLAKRVADLVKNNPELDNDGYSLWNVDGWMHDDEHQDSFGPFYDNFAEDMEVREWDAIATFQKNCNLKVKGNIISEAIRQGRLQQVTTPYATIDVNWLLSYRNTHKGELQRAAIVMLLAIRSIIGRRRYASTTRQMILSRMVGQGKLTGLKEKYSHRRQFEHARDYLRVEGLLKCWAAIGHRVYVSTSCTVGEIAADIKIKKGKKELSNDTHKLRTLLRDTS